MRAPGSQSSPGQLGWAGATQKQVLLRAQVPRRAQLFPGDLLWALPTWARRTLPVRVMPVRGRRIQTQRLQPIELARAEAWQAGAEPAAQQVWCEQQLFLRQ